MDGGVALGQYMRNIGTNAPLGAGNQLASLSLPRDLFYSYKGNEPSPTFFKSFRGLTVNLFSSLVTCPTTRKNAEDPLMTLLRTLSSHCESGPLVMRRREAFQLVQTFHGLHRLNRIVVDARRVQAAALLEWILRQA